MDGDISALLKQVMENPQFGAMVDSMKGQLGGEGGSMELSGVMEKLPALMHTLGPMLGAMRTGQHAGDSVPGGEAVPAAAVVEEAKEEPAAAPAGVQDQVRSGEKPLFGHGFSRPGSRDKRNKLLSALKPYLSPARCSLVDRAMSAMQLGELLGTVMPGDGPGEG